MQKKGVSLAFFHLFLAAPSAPFYPLRFTLCLRELSFRTLSTRLGPSLSRRQELRVAILFPCEEITALGRATTLSLYWLTPWGGGREVITLPGVLLFSQELLGIPKKFFLKMEFQTGRHNDRNLRGLGGLLQHPTKNTVLESSILLIFVKPAFPLA